MLFERLEGARKWINARCGPSRRFPPPVRRLGDPLHLASADTFTRKRLGCSRAMRSAPITTAARAPTSRPAGARPSSVSRLALMPMPRPLGVGPHQLHAIRRAAVTSRTRRFTSARGGPIRAASRGWWRGSARSGSTRSRPRTLTPYWSSSALMGSPAAAWPTSSPRKSGRSLMRWRRRSGHTSW
jgi:hypothetical protein